MSVAIIILHYGNIKETIRCLKSLERLKNPGPTTIYLVDNGTGEITARLVQRFSLNLRIVRNKKNLGYAGGNNTGIKLALKNNYKNILLLNNDTIVNPTLLSELGAVLKNPSVGLAGCIISYTGSKKIWFAGGEINTVFCFTRHTRMNETLRNEGDDQIKVDFITGAAVLVKREVFERIGLLPENYFLYWEDVDFCYNARKVGYKCVIVNKALVEHSVSASTGKKGTNTLSPLRAYYYARNPFIFIVRNRLNVLTGVLGQIFIRLPYFFMSLSGLKSLQQYLLGMRDGFKEIIGPKSFEIIK